MNLDDLQRKLIAAARAHHQSDAVPYTFDRRIMNRLKELRAPDFCALWARALWRAAAPCVALALILAAWSLLITPRNSSSSDFSQEFENTVLAAANLDQPAGDSVR